MKTPQLSLSMLDGKKLVENREKPLRLGWHLVYTLKSRDLKELEDFAPLIDALSYPAERMEECYEHAIGLIYIDSVRAPEDCNGYPWAKKDSTATSSHIRSC